MKSFVWIMAVSLGLALVEASPPPLLRKAAQIDRGGASQDEQLTGFLSQFMAAGSLSSKPGEDAPSQSSSDASRAEEGYDISSISSPESKEPLSKSRYGGDRGRHSSYKDHDSDGYDSYDDGHDSYDGGYDSYDDHHDDYSSEHGYHEEKEEEPYFQAALDCRFRVFPYVTKPEECSNVKVKDYEPDFLFDSPSKKEAKGYCYWDFHRAKVDPGGACLCPRPKKECKEKKKQCFWHTYPNIGKLHDDKDKKSGYYGSKHDKHKGKSSGVCIHNSERFYNLMAKLLAKRGKKDLSLQIHYSSAPARGKLPYGPHGPAIIGYGKEFEQRHGTGYKPEYYREEHSGYDNQHGYGESHYGYGENHYGYREPEPYLYGIPEIYGGEHYLPHPYGYQHVATDGAHYAHAPPSYDNSLYSDHGYENNEYGFEPYPMMNYNHQSHQVYDYVPQHEARWPMSGPEYHHLPGQVDTYYLEPEVEIGSYHSEPSVYEPSPYDWQPAPWTMMPMYHPYPPMHHYMPNHHQCPTPYAPAATHKTESYAVQPPQNSGYAAVQPPLKTDAYATVQPPLKTDAYAPPQPSYDAPAPTTYQQQPQEYSAPPSSNHQYKAPASPTPSYHQDKTSVAPPTQYQHQGHHNIAYQQAAKPNQVYQSPSNYATSPPRYAPNSNYPSL